jgi:hypothetical protein
MVAPQRRHLNLLMQNSPSLSNVLADTETISNEPLDSDIYSRDSSRTVLKVNTQQRGTLDVRFYEFPNERVRAQKLTSLVSTPRSPKFHPQPQVNPR